MRNSTHSLSEADPAPQQLHVLLQQQPQTRRQHVCMLVTWHIVLPPLISGRDTNHTPPAAACHSQARVQITDSHHSSLSADGSRSLHCCSNNTSDLEALWRFRGARGSQQNCRPPACSGLAHTTPTRCRHNLRTWRETFASLQRH